MVQSWRENARDLLGTRLQSRFIRESEGVESGQAIQIVSFKIRSGRAGGVGGRAAITVARQYRYQNPTGDEVDQGVHMRYSVGYKVWAAEV